MNAAHRLRVGRPDRAGRFFKMYCLRTHITAPLRPLCGIPNIRVLENVLKNRHFGSPPIHARLACVRRMRCTWLHRNRANRGDIPLLFTASLRIGAAMMIPVSSLCHSTQERFGVMCLAAHDAVSFCTAPGSPFRGPCEGAASCGTD
jgi:hypothetical protein